MSWSVRPALVADRERMLDVWERSVRATHHFLTDDDVVALRPQVAVELASDALEWWVLISEAEKTIGFLGFANDAIEGLFVDPEHHGRGAGKYLVNHAQSLAGGPLSVDVNEENGAARAFYESLDFAVTGRTPTDSSGRPFPLLHMKRPSTPSAVHQSETDRA